jgi:hypothetical protein
MSAVVKTVTKAVTNVVNSVVKVVDDVVQHPVEAIVAIAGQAVGIPAPVTYNSIRTVEQGGDLLDVAKSAALSYVATEAVPVVAESLAPTVSSAITDSTAANALTTATSKALVNGSIAAATGGDFVNAATGSFAGSLAASGYEQYLAPSVAEQAKSFGLDKSTTAGIQNVLQSSVAAGTSTAAKGGDFVDGFSNAFAQTGLDVTASSLANQANQGIKNVTKTAAADYGVDVNPPTDAGIPQTLVADVPMSPEGQLAQESSVPTEDLLQQISQRQKPAEYGQQYGPALAASQYAGTSGYEPAQISGYETISDNVPEDVAGVLQPVEVTEKALTDDDLKRAAITGDTALLSGVTQLGDIAPMGDVSQGDTTTPSFDFNNYLRDINQKATASSQNAVDAQVQAMLNPTPENIAAAKEAQMAAELDNNTLSSVLQQNTAAADLPKTSDVLATEALNVEPAYKTSDVLATEALAGYPSTVDQGVTGAGGVTPYDPSIDLEAFGGTEPSYGSGVTGQAGTGTTPTVGVPSSGGAPSSGGTSALNAIKAAISAAAGSGGRNFIPSASPLYQTTTSYQRNAAPNIDMQSNIYMSPEEFAARTQLSNLFKVARGGLITLKNLR